MSCCESTLWSYSNQNCMAWALKQTEVNGTELRAQKYSRIWWTNILQGILYQLSHKGSPWQGTLQQMLFDSLFNKRCSVHFSRSVESDSLQPHEPQHTRPPCPSPTGRVYPNPSPSSRWCHPTISSSVVPYSSRLQSFPASGSFQMSQLFTLGGQSIGVSNSTSVLPMNPQGWSPLGWTGWISLQSKGLSRVSSNTTVQKHQFFSAQLSSQSNSHIHTWPVEKP